MTKNEARLMRAIRDELEQYLGGDEWSNVSLESIYSMFGSCDSVSEAIRLVETAVVDPEFLFTE